MNTRTTYALIAILAAVGTISFMPAYSAHHEGDGHGLPPACPDCEGGDPRMQAMNAAMSEVPVTVWTDSELYNHESVIMVSGQVANVKSGMPVTLTVTSPLNNVVTIQQLDVNSDGSFASTLNTAGSLWKYDGTYVIRVQYGSQEVNNKVLVELTGGIDTRPTPAKPSVSCSSSELAVGNSCIQYSITGATITGASASSAGSGMNALAIGISSAEGGMITIDPSKANCNESGYLVFIDGEESDDVLVNGNELTIEFPPGAEEIEVIGTCVVPEFGTITALILAVAIVSIIAVSARSRLSIMPKF